MVVTHRKNMAAPREDLVAMVEKFCEEKKIKYCSAPFEADPQVVELQKCGAAKHIMPTDEDMFVLGGDSIVSEVELGKGQCCIYNCEGILQRTSMGGGKFCKEDLPLIGCFSGNDFIKRLNNNGHKKLLL